MIGRPDYIRAKVSNRVVTNVDQSRNRGGGLQAHGPVPARCWSGSRSGKAVLQRSARRRRCMTQTKLLNFDPGRMRLDNGGGNARYSLLGCWRRISFVELPPARAWGQPRWRVPSRQGRKRSPPGVSYRRRIAIAATCASRSSRNLARRWSDGSAWRLNSKPAKFNGPVRRQAGQGLCVFDWFWACPAAQTVVF